MRMSISVIIPIKNRAHLLVTTLDNILSQSVKPTEIIVVDDHSSDDLNAVKERYKDRVLFIPSHGTGPGAARNTGFLASTGSRIQFFDSDDLMTVDKLEIQQQQLSTSSSGMAYCPHVKALQNTDGTWQQTDSILYFQQLPTSLRYDQWLLRGACMITQSCLFNRELIQEAGLWRTDLMPHEDLEFLFRIGKVEPYPVHSPIPAVIYRQHQFQITDKSTTTNARAKDQLNAYHFIYNQMDGNYTYLDKKVLAGNIIRSSAFVEKSLWPADYTKTVQSNINKSIYQISKLSRKVQRIITKSDWLYLHGINKDPRQFEIYIKKLY